MVPNNLEWSVVSVVYRRIGSNMKSVGMRKVRIVKSINKSIKLIRIGTETHSELQLAAIVVVIAM